MKGIFVAITLIASIKSFANQDAYQDAYQAMTIRVSNELEQFSVEKVQLVYESKRNFVCGKFDEGSVVAKLEFMDYAPAREISVEKERRHGLCTYKLSKVLVIGANPYGYSAEYVRLPVINSYNERYYDQAPVTDRFQYECEHGEDYGCDYIEDVAAIDSDEISITLSNK